MERQTTCSAELRQELRVDVGWGQNKSRHAFLLQSPRRIFFSMQMRTATCSTAGSALTSQQTLGSSGLGEKWEPPVRTPGSRAPSNTQLENTQLQPSLCKTRKRERTQILDSFSQALRSNCTFQVTESHSPGDPHTPQVWKGHAAGRGICGSCCPQSYLVNSCHCCISAAPQTPNLRPFQEACVDEICIFLPLCARVFQIHPLVLHSATVVLSMSLPGT